MTCLDGLAHGLQPPSQINPISIHQDDTNGSSDAHLEQLDKTREPICQTQSPSSSAPPVSCISPGNLGCPIPRNSPESGAFQLSLTPGFFPDRGPSNSRVLGITRGSLWEAGQFPRPEAQGSAVCRGGEPLSSSPRTFLSVFWPVNGTEHSHPSRQASMKTMEVVTSSPDRNTVESVV